MNWEKEIENISNWMKNYLKSSGCKGYVAGISGGIDSAVSVYLAVKAVGKENVIGVSLPCQTREDMKTDAEELAENLGIKFLTINLEDCIFSLWRNMDNPQFKDPSMLTQGNMKARLRMTTLYAVASENNYLVAGTGNKSELDIGYFTKYGDGGVDIEPIGNYYKTEVYRMAKLMPEIPESIITKKPSADLWDGQTDEQEIGMSYKKLDIILRRYENCCKWYQVHFDTDGITKEQFNKVKNMVESSVHKNSVPPRYI